VPHVRRWLKSVARPREFAEPFAGGGIVGLSVLFDGFADALTLVELDEEVGAVWQVILNGCAAELCDRIMSFVPTRKSAIGILARSPRTLLDRAFATILKNRLQRGGIIAPGASLMREGENGNGIRSRWYPETLKKRILAIHGESDRISFLAGDGIEFIRNNAHRRDMAFLIDPPYTVAARRLYTHSVIDHAKLFEATANVRGNFLMTYDDTQEIRDLAQRHGYDTETVPMKSTHHLLMKELLIARNLDWCRSEAFR
jgi:DNA adenine methylase